MMDTQAPTPCTCMGGIVRLLERLVGVQAVGDLVRVVLVHLAAEGSQVQLARHRPRSLCAASSGVRIHTCCTRPSRSTRYFTSAPGATAAGTTTRFDSSRICAPAARTWR